MPAPTPSPVALMTARERVVAALAFRPVDRLPRDLGSSTGASGIHVLAYARLRNALGLPPRPGPKRTIETLDKRTRGTGAHHPREQRRNRGTDTFGEHCIPMTRAMAEQYDKHRQ